ncbi:hypothetical protein C2E23DRAFT_692683, partial [Lenzites betulinus]
RPDYALRANGARIYPELTWQPEQARSRAPSPTSMIGPEVVIDEDISIGRCWSVPTTGQVGIRTFVLVHPTHVTIDHIPRQVALDIDRAPRRVVLWGVVDGLPNIHGLDSLRTLDPDLQLPFNLVPHGRTSPRLAGNYAFVALAAFEYDINNDPTQTFAVFDHITSLHMDFGLFVLEVVDNWGANDVCLYRIRIHGEP